ncbi:MAG: iron-sulfur cluster assembly accessory protein [Planctomycetes bacterium]|nr:iron-sulfur cluster assembly accessory protein [Planctomycetota bacterium]
MSTKPQTDAEQTVENSAGPAAPKATGLLARAQPAAEGQGIGLSELAAQQIRVVLEKNSYPDTMYLYVGVKGGGCSGLQYVLDLRDEAKVPPAENDQVFSSHGLAVVCDLKSYVVGALDGTTIDYRDELMGGGFVFNNPNAKRQCGCGSSYTA